MPKGSYCGKLGAPVIQICIIRRCITPARTIKTPGERKTRRRLGITVSGPSDPRVRSTLLTEFHGAGPNAPGYLVRLPGEAFIPICDRPRDAAGHLDLGSGGEQPPQIGHPETPRRVHTPPSPSP